MKMMKRAPDHFPTHALAAAAGAAALLLLSACGGGGDDDDAGAEPLAAEAQDTTPADAAAAADTDEGRAQASATASTVGALRLASASATGAAATGSGSVTCAVSADGSLVLFQTRAANLVAGDTNGVDDLFLKNLNTGAIKRVTTTSTGAQLAAGGNCLSAGMTPDGRVVTFNSASGSTAAVFAKNTVTGALSAVSPPAGSVANVRGFFGGAISDDGTKVVFTTQPEQVGGASYLYTNVVPQRLMLRDLGTGSLATLPTDNGNVSQGEITSVNFAISPDGQRVAFSSSSGNLVAGGTYLGSGGLFVQEIATGANTLVAGTGGNQPRFIGNGRLSFGNAQASLGPTGLYLTDLSTGALELVLSNADGGASASLGADARLVVFSRFYSGFNSRIFVRDRLNGAETLASASAAGTPSNGQSTGQLISRDGTRVIFGSSATNLVSPRPAGGLFQVYAKTVAAPGGNP